jgi:hypothetical protein
MFYLLQVLILKKYFEEIFDGIDTMKQLCLIRVFFFNEEV